MWIDEAGFGREHGDAVAEQLRLRDVELVLDHLLDPERQVRHGDLLLHAVVDAVDALVLEAGQVQHGLAHRLARDGARVDAGAADRFAALDERDTLAELGGLDRGALARRAGPDDEKLVAVHATG